MPPDVPHILVVDDDNRLRELLRRYLVDNGFRVNTARDAAQARGQLGGLAFDAMVLDVMMPGESGVHFASALRAEGHGVPILMLTARGEVDDRIAGLETGVDDYMTKPFEPRELALRLKAILRRVTETPPADAAVPDEPLSLGRFRFDPARGELTGVDGHVRLTTSEANLMRLLAAHPHAAVGRDALAGLAANSRAIDVQVTRLRRKIEDDPKQPRYLQTVRGRGYMLVPD